MSTRRLLAISIAMCLPSAGEQACAQTTSGATTPGATLALPPITVTGTKPGVKRGNDQRAIRRVRAIPTVPVYPTTPLPGSDIEADKTPASINVIDANQIKQTESLNISDALVKYVPGIIVNESSG